MPAARVAGDADGRDPATVLIADDEELVRAVAARILETLGYTVLQAGNGAEALELFRGNREQVRLVFLDVRIPVMDGIEAFRRLKALEPSLPVLFWSGDTGRTGVENLLCEDSAGFIHKPFDLEALSAAISALPGIG